MASPQYSKTKGREWETACVDYQLANGVPGAERRRLCGVNDKGDLAGIIGVVTECKHEKSYKLPGWIKELRAEMVNAGARIGAVWARQNGKPGVEHAFVITTPEVWMRLLAEAGYIAEMLAQPARIAQGGLTGIGGQSGTPGRSVSLSEDDALMADLPGMWEAADFTGGLDEVRPAASDAA